MSESPRPTTSSTRPMTGDSALLPSLPLARRRRPATETVDEGDEEEEWSDDEDDPGMFSYLAPASAVDTASSIAPSSVPASPAHLRTDSDRPFVPSLLAPSPIPAARLTRSSSTTLSEQHIQCGIDAGLSPAAAYALASSETESQASIRSPSVLDGARRRGTFQYPESPTYSGENPFTAQSFKAESQKMVDEFARKRTPLVESELGFRPRAAQWTGESRPDTGRTDYTQETTELSYDDRDGSTLSDSSSVGYKMKNMGQSTSIVDGKLTSLKERELAFAGLNPLDFGGFTDDDEDSPYPEVRASVSNIDDVDMPCLTFRSWFLGLFFTVIVSAVNVFFTFRYPAPIVTPVIVQVISYPFGKALAQLLPATTFRVPKWMQKLGFEDEFSFNPGPFNIKEHTVIVIMANAATGPAYALNFSLASQKFYGVRQGLAFDFLLLLTTQLVGFGMAGICRKYLVWPAALIWPQNLVFCTLLNTLHAEDDDGSEGGVTRFRFFTYVMGGAFCWYFLPGFLFQALSVFSFVCWMAPTNPVVNQLFGLSTGLGMSMLTFDWAQIAYIGSPLVIPWWAEVNIFVGFFVTFWVVVPALYYSNVWNTSYLPMSIGRVFDRFGEVYNTSRVINPETFLFNATAYEEYSPLYLPVTFAALYGLSFALATSVLVHTALYHGSGIIKRYKNARGEDDDIHAKLMREYREVPDWWYWIYLALFAGLSIATVYIQGVQLPIWGLLVSLGISFLYILPSGYIFAMTSQQINMNVLVQFVAGYMFPGAPLGNMLFKLYSLQATGVALAFVQDLKLGHYMKIPPRSTFSIQVVATTISALLQVGVKEWLLNAVPDLCDLRQPALLVCPQTRIFYSASIIWGLVGPARQFSSGGTYSALPYLLVFGALLPIPFWLLGRRYPNSWIKYVNIPVMIGGATYMPPATGINYSSWFVVGFIFQFWMRRNRFQWWSKFNFVLSAALDSGTVLGGLFIFFALQLPRDGTITVDWWGNSVFTNTADWAGQAYRAIPDIGFFGAESGWQ